MNQKTILENSGKRDLEEAKIKSMKTVSQEFSEVLQKNSSSKFNFDQMTQVSEQIFMEKNLEENQDTQSSEEEKEGSSSPSSQNCSDLDSIKSPLKNDQNNPDSEEEMEQKR